MVDVAASALARLRAKAKETGTSYQQCLQLFFQEEFLRKLAASTYCDNLILKGGLFIYTLTNFQSRSTVDVDFLMKGLNNDIERMNEIIAEILEVSTGNDYLTFRANKCEPIAVHRKYHGISTQITGHIKNIRVPFQIDIGVGDIIVPKEEKRRIQTQLEGYEQPLIMTYSLESTIAEKFDAILQRMELTGRMKDFYDIYYLGNIFEFEGRKLQEAMLQTLQNRGTTYERDSFERISALSNNADMRVKWNYFLKTINNKEIMFLEVIEEIEQFLNPVFVAIIEEKEFFDWWNPKNHTWEILKVPR
jgi:predicted nucleotidyltransferase component of viral defense system